MREYDRVLRDQSALVTHAAGFAARVHAGRTRKGESSSPFILHLAEVADLLAKALEEPMPISSRRPGCMMPSENDDRE